MRKMPNCPRCSENDLQLSRRSAFVLLRCIECGWQAILTPLLDNKDLSREIAATVAAAKQHVGDDAAGGE